MCRSPGLANRTSSFCLALRAVKNLASRSWRPGLPSPGSPPYVSHSVHGPVSLEPGVAQQGERLVLRVAVAPVGRDHVVARAHVREEARVDVADAAVVGQLEHVDGQRRPAVGQQAGVLEAVDDVVGAGVAGEQQRCAVPERREHDDARQVEHRAVEVGGLLGVGTGVVALPLRPRGPQLLELLLGGREHGERQAGHDLDRRGAAAALHEAAAEPRVALDVERDRVLVQSDAALDAGGDRLALLAGRGGHERLQRGGLDAGLCPPSRRRR